MERLPSDDHTAMRGSCIEMRLKQGPGNLSGMIEAREYTTCVECSTHIVRILHAVTGATLSTIHSDPENEAAMSCALNPAALPEVRARRAG